MPINGINNKLLFWMGFSGQIKVAGILKLLNVWFLWR